MNTLKSDVVVAAMISGIYVFSVTNHAVRTGD